MNPTTPESQSAVVIRSAEDLLAHIPCVLGFVPTDSVVMVSCSGGSGMHARVALPRSARERTLVAEQLSGASVANGITAVALVLYADDACSAAETLGELEVTFLLKGISVDVALRVADDRWFLMLPGDHDREAPGIPFDTSAHPFAARAVVAGQVTHASRDDLVASIAADPVRVAGVQALLGTVAPVPFIDPASDALWATEVVLGHVAEGTQPAGAELVRLLSALRHECTQEELICVLTRPGARALASFWASLMPTLPPEHVAPVGGLLALSAWVAGDGALAWCAIDRIDAAPDASELGEFVAVMLEKAVPPTVWDRSVA